MGDAKGAARRESRSVGGGGGDAIDCAGIEGREARHSEVKPARSLRRVVELSDVRVESYSSPELSDFSKGSWWGIFEGMYNHPSQAEPYLPAAGLLARQARLVSEAANDLMARVPQASPTPRVIETRKANAVYSNRIEGEEGAEYRAAHDAAEAALDSTGLVDAQALDSAVLKCCHRELFSSFDSASFGTGKLRTQHVKVQRHVPPLFEALPAFLARADQVYLQSWKSPAELLIAVAAAHHRMTWIHPFQDGNGRAIRLQSQLALRPLGSRFWSISAGLWRRRDDYFRLLAEADEHRLGDLDGRGNLSEKRLVAWCEFFISVVDEEVHAAASQLQLGLK